MEQGRKRGREGGLQEGKQDLVLEPTGRRFGSVPKDLARRVRSIRDRDRLTHLAEQVLDVESLDDLDL